MTFKNAYHGIKKVFTAELLTLIGTVCFLIAILLGLLFVGTVYIGSDSGAVASGIGAIVFIIGGIVLWVVGYIMNLVGLSQAGKDEDNIHIAFIVSIFVLLLRIVSGIFMLLGVGGGIADNIASTIGGVCEIVVFVLVITGVSVLANKLGKPDMVRSGATLMRMLVAVYCISILATLVVAFFGPNPTALTVCSILEAVSALFSIVGYIIYLVFLGRAKNMLRDN